MQPNGTAIDRSTVGSLDGALGIGSRIVVRWQHGWEAGTISHVRHQLERGALVCTYTIVYDDGEVRAEGL